MRIYSALYTLHFALSERPARPMADPTRSCSASALARRTCCSCPIRRRSRCSPYGWFCRAPTQIRPTCIRFGCRNRSPWEPRTMQSSSCRQRASIGDRWPQPASTSCSAGVLARRQPGAQEWELWAQGSGSRRWRKPRRQRPGSRSIETPLESHRHSRGVSGATVVPGEDREAPCNGVDLGLTIPTPTDQFC